MAEMIIHDEEKAGQFIGGHEAPVSKRTMQRWRLEGVGPTYFKIGRLVRYRQVDLEEFMEEGMCKASFPIVHSQSAYQTTINKNGGYCNV